MCNLSDGVWNEAMEKGVEQGIEQGILTSLKNLMNNMHWTAEQAVEALGISEEDKPKYSSLLSK